MNSQSSTTNLILSLLVPTIIVTAVDSYIPHELTLVRQVLSLVQLALMAMIAIVTVRAILKDF